MPKRGWLCRLRSPRGAQFWIFRWSEVWSHPREEFTWRLWSHTWYLAWVTASCSRLFQTWFLCNRTNNQVKVITSVQHQNKPRAEIIKNDTTWSWHESWFIHYCALRREFVEILWTFQPIKSRLRKYKADIGGENGTSLSLQENIWMWSYALKGYRSGHLIQWTWPVFLLDSLVSWSDGTDEYLWSNDED